MRRGRKVEGMSQILGSNPNVFTKFLLYRQNFPLSATSRAQWLCLLSSSYSSLSINPRFSGSCYPGLERCPSNLSLKFGLGESLFISQLDASPSPRSFRTFAKPPHDPTNLLSLTFPRRAYWASQWGPTPWPFASTGFAYSCHFPKMGTKASPSLRAQGYRSGYQCSASFVVVGRGVK